MGFRGVAFLNRSRMFFKDIIANRPNLDLEGGQPYRTFKGGKLMQICNEEIDKREGIKECNSLYEYTGKFDLFENTARISLTAPHIE